MRMEFVRQRVRMLTTIHVLANVQAGGKLGAMGAEVLS